MSLPKPGSKMRHKEKTRINVGGKIFQCHTHNLQRYKHSLLANLDTDSEHYDEQADEYFFDRDPVVFNFILNAYRTGTVHFPRDVCGANFREELEFWGLDEQIVGECCWETLYRSENTLQTIDTLKGFYQFYKFPPCTDNQSHIQRKIWEFLHEPKSSGYAKAWCVFISFVMTVSVLVTFFYTTSAARTGTYNDAETANIDKIVQLLQIDENSKRFATIYKKPSAIATSLDASCFLVLTLELLLVFCVCPSKWEFLKCGYHLLEICCSLFYWFYIFCYINLEHISSMYVLKAMIISRYFAILKIVRLLRVARHFPALRIMGLTLYVSRRELNMLTCMLFILISLFGTLAYMLEGSNDSTFDNGFDAMYWAVITLTTVGYGDLTLKSPLGRALAGLCSVCGVLMLALPIGIFASNFDNLYRHHQYVSRQYEIKREKMRFKDVASRLIANALGKP